MEYKFVQCDEEIKALRQLHDAEALLQEYGVEVVFSSIYSDPKLVINICVCDSYIFYSELMYFREDLEWVLYDNVFKIQGIGTLKELMLKWKNIQ